MRAFAGQLVPWVARHDREQRPQPLRIACAYAAVAAASLGVSYAAAVPWPELLVAPISFFLLGFIQSALAWDDFAQRRRSADRWLRLRPVLPDPRHAWRADELTSARERRMLSRSLRRLVREVDGRLLPGPAPLNTSGLRPYTADLTALADRLADLERPVTPSGVLRVHEFLQNPGSPVYERANSEFLPLLLFELTYALEPR